MQITRSVLQDQSFFIKSCLSRSHVISLDFQLSGINAPRYRPSSSDTISQRYFKYRKTLDLYPSLQLGLCGFQIIGPTQMIAYPFSFNLRPMHSRRQTFCFESGSASFLTGHGFDFNRCLYEGIQIINKALLKKRETTDKLRLKELELQVGEDSSKNPASKLLENVYKSMFMQFIKGNPNQLKEFQIEILDRVGPSLLVEILEKIRRQHPSLTFSYRFSPQHQPIKKKLFLSHVAQEQTTNSRSHKTLSSAESTTVKSVNSLIHEIYDEAITANKPIVAHNGFLDIMHLYNLFLDEPPESINQFNKNLSQRHSTIYDTKYIFTNSPVLFLKAGRTSTLDKIYQALRLEEGVNVVLGTGFRLDDMAQHDAGYDAYMTGVTYFKSLFYSSTDRFFNQFTFFLYQETFTDFSPSKLSQENIYRNKLAVSRMNQYFLVSADTTVEEKHKALGEYYLRPVCPEHKVSKQELQSRLGQRYGIVELSSLPLPRSLENQNGLHYSIRFTDKKSQNNFESTLRLNQSGVCITNLDHHKYFVADPEIYTKLFLS